MGASKEGLKDISPFNTVHSFQNFYVVRILNVVGSTCAGLFHNSELYGNFLNVVQEWILNGMFPKPENVRLSVAQQIASMELMLPAFENADETSDRSDLIEPSVLKAIYEARPDLKTNNRLPALMIEAFRQDRIIRVRESFSKFDQRFDWDAWDRDYFFWGGDWEHMVIKSLQDVQFGEDNSSFEGEWAAGATLDLLRNASNREEVKGIWEEALGKSRAMLLGEWRNVPQHAAGVLQATTAKILTERRSEWLDDKLAGKYSDVNLSETGKISYNTIQSYRRGGRIRASTRRALSDALNELGISCNFEEVRQ